MTPSLHIDAQAVAPPAFVLPLGERVRLAKLRVLFAHQSVGADLLRGAAAVSEVGLARPLPIVARTSTTLPAPGTWAEVSIGQNGDAASKLAHLEELVAGGYAQGFDALLFKLCYADVLPGAGALRLLDAIYGTFERIRKLAPGLRLVPMTVPLNAPEHGARAWLKKALRRESWVAAANREREALNVLLRDAFAGWPLFDLAALESRGVTYQGAPALDPALTDDGGHLNARGRVELGGALLAFAATLPLAREL